MGIFSRKEKTPHGDRHESKMGRRQKAHHDPLPMSRKPSFGQWIKHTWFDIVTMAVMGAIGLGVSHIHAHHSSSQANNNFLGLLC